MLSVDEVTDPYARAVLKEIEDAYGMVPNLFKAYANYPPLLRANWVKTKAVMMTGALSRELKESIAVVVSSTNNCDYCVQAHSAMLRNLQTSESRISALCGDLDEADFTSREKAILLFVRKATMNPFLVSDLDLERLGSMEVNHAEVVEILGVVELFTGYNKFLDSMAIENDF